MPSFGILSYCLFILFMGFSRQEDWSGLPFPSPVDHILSELFTMTHPSWVALHGMAHSFIDLDKAVIHVIKLVSDDCVALEQAAMRRYPMSKIRKTPPCLTQWNYEPCHVGPPKMDGSWWKVLTKCDPLEMGMANHFSILGLRTPWTVWKGKKIGHWEINYPGQ